MTGLGFVLRDVHHRYDAREVLEDIDLTIAPGRVTVIIGPSGCGKSTLLGLLAGLLRPTSGSITQEGAAGPACLAPLAWVFQDFALLPWRTVARNVALVLEGRLDRAARAARVAEVLTRTGLTEFAQAWPRQLSGGMRQRVGIARALAVRPACLLMDEPLSALDAQTRAVLLDDLCALIAGGGITTVYVTHNLREAVRLGQRIVVLSHRPGRIRRIVDLDAPIAGREPDLALEQELWHLLRDDAAMAVQEREDA